MYKIILYLVLSVFSSFAHAIYTPYPQDTISEKLGMGIVDDYVTATYPTATVTYICDTLPNGNSNATGDTTGNGSLATPYYSINKVRTLMSTAEANSAFAFCRGGKFVDMGPLAAIGQVSTKSRRWAPITIRDYQKVGGARELPILVAADISSNTLFMIETSGTAPVAHSGLVFKNLQVTSTNYFSGLMWIKKDFDYGVLDNIRFFNTGRGTSSAAYVSSVTTAVPNDYRTVHADNTLVFTHNVDGTPDTITTTQVDSFGNSVFLKEGCMIKITGAVNPQNNGAHRIDSWSADRLTVYLTKVADDRGIVNHSWDVVNESGTVGTTVQIVSGDGINSGWTIKNTRFENIGSNTAFMSLSHGGSFHDNENINVGFANDANNHHLYIGSSEGGGSVYNNFMYKNSHVKGLIGSITYPGGNCEATGIVAHGHTYDIEVYNNTIIEDQNAAGNNCWGISFDPGYADSQGAEYHVRPNIHDNRLVNMGNIGISCKACESATINHNFIWINHTDQFLRGVQVPDTTGATSLDHLNTSISITNNWIESIQGSFVDTDLANSAGVWIACTDATCAPGTVVTVTGNTIKEFYRCTNNVTTGVNTTVNISGNTCVGNTL